MADVQPTSSRPAPAKNDRPTKHRTGPQNPPSGSRTFCCGRWYNKKALEIHIATVQVHKGETPALQVHCGCGRRFGSATALEDHKRDSPKHNKGKQPVAESSTTNYVNFARLLARFATANTRESPARRIIPLSPSPVPTPPLPDDPYRPDAIDVFFAKFPTFAYNSNARYRGEFGRLCSHKGWLRPKLRDESVSHEPQNVNWRQLREAAIEAFGTRFGTRIDDIEAWGRLCGAIGMDVIPKDLGGRIKAVMTTHVNILDLFECHRRTPREIPPIFDTEEDLAEYSKHGNLLSKPQQVLYREDYSGGVEGGLYFPRPDAKANELLAFLLRQLLNEYHGTLRIGKDGRLPRNLCQKLGIKQV